MVKPLTSTGCSGDNMAANKEPRSKTEIRAPESIDLPSGTAAVLAKAALQPRQRVKSAGPSDSWIDDFQLLAEGWMSKIEGVAKIVDV
ncbi:hypothetical protein JYU34_021995, partial [Plutella xylostella]